MTEIEDREKALTELPADVDFLQAGSGWNYARWGHADYAIQHSYYEGDNLVTDVYRLPRSIGRLIEMERRSAREELQREIRVLIGG